MCHAVCWCCPLITHSLSGVCVCVCACALKDPVQQARVIEKMMAVPNQIWDSIIARAAENSSVLQDPEIIKQLGHILKINVRGSTSIGHPFVAQVSHPHFCHGWN